MMSTVAESHKLKIAVFTSTRAEYGMLQPLLLMLQESARFHLELVVSGTHLSDDHGFTLDEITADGFIPADEIDYIGCGGSSISAKMAYLSLRFGEYLEKSTPSICILLGDRYELIPVAFNCLLSGTPIAHISGGDVTEGAIDDQVRHSLSKMSHLHFTGTEASRQNVISLAESQERVFNVGELAIDRIKSTKLIPEKELVKGLNIPYGERIICFTLHPETIDNSITVGFAEDLLERLYQNFPHYFIITGSNEDPGGEELNRLWRRASSKYNRIRFFPSLGQVRFFSVMSICDLLIGNSSSGIVEAIGFGTPVIDIGNRQKGRLANGNVIHSTKNLTAIVENCRKALSSTFKKSFEGEDCLYGDGFTSPRIMNILDRVDIDTLFQKQSSFSNLGVPSRVSIEATSATRPKSRGVY